MKRKTVSILVIVMAFILMLLTACGDDSESAERENLTSLNPTYSDAQATDENSTGDTTCHHDYKSEITKEATCSTSGIETFTCSACGDSYTEVLSKKEHDYKSKTTKAATCSERGVKTFTCSGCGDSYTEEIRMKDHEWKDATCSQPMTCSGCGETKGNKLAHDYNSNGVCDMCSGTIANVKLPSTSQKISYFDYKSNVVSSCNVTSVTGKCDYYLGNKYNYTITIKGSCTYNEDGDNHSSQMLIGYKLYDSDEYVVYSGTIYTNSVAVGEKFSHEMNLYYLIPGEEYKLVFLDVN